MSNAKMRMYQVEVGADRENDVVVIRQPGDFEDDQVVVLSVEQCVVVAKWLKEISEGA